MMADIMSTDIKPNNTIYINNLNEKVKKEGKNRSDGLFTLNSNPFQFVFEQN